MRLVLDTHIALAILGISPTAQANVVVERMLEYKTDTALSVASLWEIAIKRRLDKLQFEFPLEKLPAMVRELDIEVLPITDEHALADVQPIPLTRDPFDRLLLGVCKVENRQLVTLDRALKNHPLAWKTA